MVVVNNGNNKGKLITESATLDCSDFEATAARKVIRLAMPVEPSISIDINKIV